MFQAVMKSLCIALLQMQCTVSVPMKGFWKWSISC